MSQTTSTPTVDVVSAEDFAELRRQLEQAVLRICPPWLANDREDLVQSACLRLFKLMNKPDSPATYTPAYLRKVAFNHLIDEIRRRRRRPESPLEDGPVASHSPGPERLTLTGELAVAIRRCLADLIDPRRRAVTLSLLGHGNIQIAKLLGWTPKRAENLVTRGRADLRECLRAKGLAI